MKRVILFTLFVLFLLAFSACKKEQVLEDKKESIKEIKEESESEQPPQDTTVVTKSGKEFEIEVEKSDLPNNVSNDLTGGSTTDEKISSSWCPVGKQGNGKVLSFVGKVKADRTVTGEGIQKGGKYNNMCKITVELPSTDEDLNSHSLIYYFNENNKGSAIIDGQEYSLN